MSVSLPTSRSRQFPTSLKSLRGNVLPIAIGIIITLVLTLVYRRYSLIFETNSDFSGPMLAARDVLHGNLLLHGWFLTTVSFYTTDIPLLVMGQCLRGLDPVLMSEVPALVFALTLVAVVLLAARRSGPSPRRFHLFGALTAFALQAMPPPAGAESQLRMPVHNATLLLILLALLTLDFDGSEPESEEGKEPSLPIWRLGLFTLLLTLAIAGDTIATYIGAIPVLLVAILRLWRGERSSRRNDIALIAATAGASVIAKAFQHLLVALGGFHMPGSYVSSIELISLDKLGQNLIWTLEGLLTLYGADIFGKALNIKLAASLVKLIAVGLVSVSFWQAVQTGRKQIGAIDRVSAILAAAILTNIASYALSNAPSGLSMIRYLLPTLAFGAALAGRYGLAQSRDPGLFRILVIIAGIGSLPFFARYVLQPRFDSPERRLGVWLNEHNLHEGYGTYWVSTNITVQTHGAVMVRPIQSSGHSDGRMIPELWEANVHWYHDSKPIHFVVMRPKEKGSITPDDAARAFGPPDQAYTLENYAILVWNSDISPKLQHPPDEQYQGQ